MDNWSDKMMEPLTTTASPVLDDLTTTVWVITEEQKRDQVVLACSIAIGVLLFLAIIMGHAAIGHVKRINMYV